MDSDIHTLVSLIHSRSSEASSSATIQHFGITAHSPLNPIQLPEGALPAVSVAVCVCVLPAMSVAVCVCVLPAVSVAVCVCVLSAVSVSVCVSVCEDAS